MDSGDSDQFASADEGPEPIIPITKREALVNPTVNTKNVYKDDVKGVVDISDAQVEISSLNFQNSPSSNSVTGEKSLTKKKKKRQTRQAQGKSEKKQSLCRSDESDTLKQPIPAPSKSTKPVTSVTSPKVCKHTPEGSKANIRKVSNDDLNREHDITTAFEPTVPPVELVSNDDAEKPLISRPSTSTERTSIVTSPDDCKPSRDGSKIKFEKISKEDFDREHDTITVVEPNASIDEPLPSGHENNFSGILDTDVLSSAATSIIRNVGGGISSLAGVLGQVLSIHETDEDIAERRRRRKAEEEKDLKVTLGAWSDAWNAAWGDNSEDAGDGWEVEDTVLPAESQQSESQEKVEYEKDSSLKPVEVQEPPSTDSSRREQPTETWSWAGVSSFAQNLTNTFQKKGLNLVQGSVDVLEKIGRKTMSVLEENDPGFQYTKKFLRPPGLRQQPSLSQVIHEARERSEVGEGTTGAGESTALPNRGNFNYQLEANRGLVHLEALELVSYQAESRLHSRLAATSDLHDGPLETIWETLNFEDDEQMQNDSDNEGSFDDEVNRFNLGEVDPEMDEDSDLPFLKEDTHLWIVFRKIIIQLKNVYPGQKLCKILESCLRNALTSTDADKTTQEQFFTAISTLAEMTAGTLEYLHKLSECLLIHTHESDTDFLRISGLIRLLLLVNMKLKTKICTEFMGMVKKARLPAPSEEIDGKLTSTSHLIANIILEAGNAQTYLRNTARLLTPVLQLAYLIHQDGSGVDESTG